MFIYEENRQLLSVETLRKSRLSATGTKFYDFLFSNVSFYKNKFLKKEPFFKWNLIKIQVTYVQRI